MRVCLGLADPAGTTFLGAVLTVLAILTGVARITASASSKGFAGDRGEQQRSGEDSKPDAASL